MHRFSSFLAYDWGWQYRHSPPESPLCAAITPHPAQCQRSSTCGLSASRSARRSSRRPAISRRCSRTSRRSDSTASAASSIRSLAGTASVEMAQRRRRVTMSLMARCTVLECRDLPPAAHPLGVCPSEPDRGGDRLQAIFPAGNDSQFHSVSLRCLESRPAPPPVAWNATINSGRRAAKGSPTSGMGQGQTTTESYLGCQITPAVFRPPKYPRKPGQSTSVVERHSARRNLAGGGIPASRATQDRRRVCV